jgi:P4 family phage/plasmid primase-like protien
LIQILWLRDYFDEKSQKTKKAERGFSEGIRATSVEDVFLNHANLIREKIPKSEQYNIYYTVADCDENPDPRGKGRRMVEQHHIPFDVDGIEVPDVGTDGHLALLAKAVCEAIGVVYEDTCILFSGNGLQFLVGIQKPITDELYFDEARHHYKAICRRIDLTLEKLQMKGKSDVSVWSPARLMRFPGTLNIKPDKPQRMARVLNVADTRGNFILESASKLPKLEKEDFIPDVLSRSAFPTPDNETIIKECRFIGHAQTSPEKISEPQWFALLSVLSRMTEGRTLSHAFSKGHPGYSFGETETKIDQALESAGPRTCKSINDLWGKCAGCVHFGSSKVISPISITGPEHIKTENTGFFHMATSASGALKKGKPDLDGLCNYFYKKHPYKVVEGSAVWIWNGVHYERRDRPMLMEFAHEYFRPESLPNEREAFVQQLTDFRGRQAKANWFGDSTKGKMNFRNGVLHLISGEFTQHSQEAGFRTVLPYDYDKNASAPGFHRFLEEVTLARPELIRILQEFMGYTLANQGCGFQKALLLLGEGSNGKSTFVSVLKRLVGDGGSEVAISELDDSQKLYMMEGKLVNIVEENADNAFRHYEKLKNFITGGNMSIKRVYEVPYSVPNTAKFILLCNRMPASRDRSHGFYRRFLIVPFDAEFSVEAGNIDRGVSEKLASELPGILNWAMEGYRRLLDQNDFTSSDFVKEEMSRYMREQDPYMCFFEDHVDVTENDNVFVITQSSFNTFLDWGRENGYSDRDLGAKPQFTKALREYLKKKLKRAPKEVRAPGETRPRALTNMTLRAVKPLH